MKSKDIFMKAGALLLLLALLLCGCGARPLPGVYSVYIQPAELTEEEGKQWNPPRPSGEGEESKKSDFLALMQRLREKK